MVAAISAHAYDFEVDGIYYYTNSETSVTVTSPGYGNFYFGDIVIPSQISYNDKVYTVTRINDSSFNGCSNLTSVQIPNSVTQIYSCAFFDCTSLTEITIPNSIKEIEGATFYGCSSLKSVNMPNSITSIGDNAFEGCSSLTEITIPNSVKKIGTKAFYNCKNLISINLPNSVTSIGENAFRETAWYDAQEDGLVYLGPILLEYRGQMPENTSISVKTGTTVIGDHAFSGCNGLTSITFPNSVITIKQNAFHGCSNLASINIPNSLTSIGNGAFYYCSSLTEIIIPNSVTSIGNTAFCGCSNSASISIPNSVTSIGNGAFNNCSSLTEIIIPNSVTSFIPTFYGCTSLQKIYLSDKIDIGEYTFSANRNNNKMLPNLKEISVGRLKEKLGYYFRKLYQNGNECVTIEQDGVKYSVPKGLNIILRNQTEFPICALQNTIDADIAIEIYSSVEKIDVNAFDNAGITTLTFSEAIQTVSRSLFNKLPNLRFFSAKKIETIEYRAFEANTKLEKLELMFPGAGTKDAVSNFGELFGTTNRTGTRAVTQFFENGMSETYYIPTTIKELVLTEGCEMIPYGGLYNCNMLESVTLPTSLYMVGEKAFYGCAKISDIYCKGADPAVAYDNTFDGMRISSCKLHIPYNTAELYKRSAGWKNFYYFEEEAPLRISVTKTIENAGVIYGLNEYQPGQTAELKAVANSGYVFKGWLENEQPLTDNATYSFLVTDSRDLTAWFVPVLDDNSVEINSEQDGAAFAYSPVEGAVSYSLDVYSDEDLTVRVGSTTETVQNAKAMAKAAAGTKVISISGLNADSQYYYKITALAANDIILSQFTGQFRTKTMTGIDDIAVFGKPTVTARYDSTGRKIASPVKGLNIIHYSDGTIRKVMVKKEINNQ